VAEICKTRLMTRGKKGRRPKPRSQPATLMI
jgi:hypothetical protein